MREDCADKWKDTKKYNDEINRDIISPLKDLLKEHTAKQKELENKWRSLQAVYEQTKIQAEVAGAEYFRAFEEFDKNMANYEKMAPELSEEKKNRIIQRINQLLVNCKETEKSYKSQIYAVKEAKIEFHAAIVLHKLI